MLMYVAVCCCVWGGGCPCGVINDDDNYDSGFQAPPAEPGRQMHFGLSKTRLMTTSLFLLCDCITCSITDHITRR